MLIQKILHSVFVNRKPSCFKFCTLLKPMSTHSIPRRAMLYVPGDDKQKVDKSLAYKVDCIAFDFEDGVALNKKEDARNTIHTLLCEGTVSKYDPEWCVRINSVHTDYFESDVKAILSAKSLPAGIALSKVDSSQDLELFTEKVWKELVKRKEDDRGPINLLIFIESAKAIMTLPEICQKAFDLSTMAPIIPSALILGFDDLLASLGATRTTHSIEILYARQKLVLVAKAFGLQAIDIVNTNIKGLEELEKESKEGYLLGYTGKQVIHPCQIPIVQEEFSPSRSRIKWAKEIIKHFKENQEVGKGAFVLHGKMIDMPALRQAENILEAAKLSRKHIEE